MNTQIFKDNSNWALRIGGLKVGKRSTTQIQKDWYRKKYGAAWKSYYDAFLKKEAEKAYNGLDNQNQFPGDDDITNPSDTQQPGAPGYQAPVKQQNNYLIIGIVVLVVVIGGILIYKKMKK